MTNWNHEIKLRHILDDSEYESEDPAIIQKLMDVIADALEQAPSFIGLDVKPFRHIPPGDDFFAPEEYADRLLNRMYDYATINKIRIY